MARLMVSRVLNVNIYNIFFLFLNISLLGVVHLREFFPFGSIELLFLGTLILLLIVNNKSIKVSKLILMLILFTSFTVFFPSVLFFNENIKYNFMVLYGGVIFILFTSLSEDILLKLKLFVIGSAIIGLISTYALLIFYIGDHSLVDMLYHRGWYARAQGFSAGPNYYSISMLFSFFVAFYIWNKTKWGGIYVFLILIGALASISRGLMLGFVIFALIYFLSSKASKKPIIYFLMAIALIWLTGYIMLPQEVISTIMDVFERRFSDGGGGASARADSIFAVLQNLNGIHLVFGHGRFEFNAVDDIQAPHSTFVTLFADAGAFGLISFLIFLSMIFIMTVRYYKVNSLPMGIFLALMFSSLTNDYHFTKEFWLILAVVVLIMKKDLNKKENNNARS